MYTIGIGWITGFQLGIEYFTEDEETPFHIVLSLALIRIVIYSPMKDEDG